MDLRDEDEPDTEEGLKPSLAFCSQIDREAEMEPSDAMAALPSYGASEARPAPKTEVLDDNVYELRLLRSDSLEGGGSATPGMDDEDVSMEEEPLSGPRRNRLSSGPRKSSFRQSNRPSMKKRVSFTGIPELPKPWVPPHKRPGFSALCPEGAADGAEPAVPAEQPMLPKETCLPNHVAHPEKYTRYALEHPLTVGGGIGQLEYEAGSNDPPELAALASAYAAGKPATDAEPTAMGEQPAPEDRWRGGAGPGAIEFVPRTQKEGTSPAKAAVASGGISASLAACWASDDDANGGGDAMEEDVGAAALRYGDGGKSGRPKQYRSTRWRATEGADDGMDAC